MFVLGNLILCLCDFMLHEAIRPQQDLGPQFLNLLLYDRGALFPQSDHHHHAFVITFPACRRALCPLKLSHHYLLAFITGLSYPADFARLMHGQNSPSVALVLL
jgi:hypothetical protein